MAECRIIELIKEESVATAIGANCGKIMQR